MKSNFALSSFLILVLAISACSSKEKKTEALATPVATPAPHADSSDDMMTKYSIVELNSAANLLKVIVDEAGKDPNEDKGTDIIGCPLTGKQASSMTMPVKALIDQMTRGETEGYVADPKNYATERGFESCAANCACGVLSDIVEAADEASLPASAGRLHARNKQRLSVKASHQTSRDSLACARKQAWFCGSDLRAYLEKEAAKHRP